MREIFTIRFFAAVGGVAGLFFVLTTIFATREVIDRVGDDEVASTELHRIDLVEQVFSSRNPSFRLDAPDGEDGVAVNDTGLIIDGTRELRIVSGTPGVNHCPEFGTVGGCAVVADLLGEAAVWFALVPMGSGRTVDLPAIDTLEDGLATLVNGWQVPFAPVLDRRCGVGENAEEFESYREFREILGEQFVAVYDIDERRLTAVVCRQRVDYAPALTPTTAVDSTTATSVATAESTPTS